MLLHISDSKTVEDLQDHFNDCFPYLKIEFYREAGNHLKECDKSNLVNPHTFIGEIRKTAYSGTFDIKSWDKTSKVKQDLKDFFGLNVQIFRMHKNEWIPTSYSDDLTLKQQGELARAFPSFEPNDNRH
jgi:hypothetical protein